MVKVNNRGLEAEEPCVQEETVDRSGDGGDGGKSGKCKKKCKELQAGRAADSL